MTLREPNALNVEKAGFGKVVMFIGDKAGEVPYTAYNAKKSYIEKNKDVLSGFNKAVNKGLKFVLENDSDVVAKAIIGFFPDTTLSDVTLIVDRYKKADVWKDSTVITAKEWDRMQDIMINAGELKDKVKFDALIETEFFNEK